MPEEIRHLLLTMKIYLKRYLVLQNNLSFGGRLYKVATLRSVHGTVFFL